MRSSTSAWLNWNPTPSGCRDAIYDAKSRQWSVPVPEQGLMLYAVVSHQATVIVLRVIVL